MIYTIPVYIEHEGQENEYQMDMELDMGPDSIEICACFIEEIPQPSSRQQWAMQAQAESYVLHHQSHLFDEYHNAIGEHQREEFHE